MTKPASWHVLTQVDLEAHTGTCSLCGPTRVRVKVYRGRTRRQCMTTVRAQKRNRTGPRSDAERAATIEAQGGVCATCREAPAARGLLDDHDHATGRPRGMLCNRCNTILGQVQDDSALLRTLAAYVDQYR